jgi:hypothetical protein
MADFDESSVGVCAPVGGCRGASGMTVGTAGAAPGGTVDVAAGSAACLPPNERFFVDRVFGSEVP